MLTVLGLMDGRERLVAFLVELSRKLTRRGFAPSEFILRMSREEIGAYLSLKLETVSRLFKTLAEEGLIEVDYRYIKLLNRDALNAIYARSSSFANPLDKSGTDALPTTPAGPPLPVPLAT
jgi:CRP/FNR family transcriptional regulator